jgi:condensin complex subunit 2
VPFSIDFTTPATLSSKELFEPGTKTATMLPKSKRKATEDHTLPDDMHFNSQQLLRLFLKPKAIVRPLKLVRLLLTAPYRST